jgi:stage V sporulation protein D (sporulation-specific penicillin-binding protein)
MENKTDSFTVRLLSLFLIFLAIFLIIFLRLLYLQVVHREYYMAELQTIMAPEVVNVKGERGDIIDRKGIAIVVNKPSYELDINPSYLTENEKQMILLKLPSILKVDKKYLLGIMDKYKVFVRISTTLTSQQKDEIKKLGIKNGVAITPTEERIYPFHNLLSDVIGFVGSDDEGLSGIEYKFNRFLKGVGGKIFWPKVSPRPVVPNVSMFEIKPEKGDTVQLTIDSNIQYISEKYLKEAINKNKAKSGVVIVMDPHNGDVLAMASYPNFDPNDPNSRNNNNIVNRAIQMNYEPGSVLKPIIAAAALQEGSLHTDDSFYCSGSLRVKDRVLHCWRTHGEEHGLNEIMRNSCDVAFMKIGLKLGKEQLLRYFRRFGFGEYTGIELPGEEKGIVPDMKSVGDVELATMSYGQGVAVTPLQLIDAFCAIANKGIEMKPVIVRSVKNSDGKVKYYNAPKVRKVVISPKVASEVMDALKAVVTDKGVPQAELDGYTIAGKTGTAQKPNAQGGYSNTKLIYSFCGIVPADDPQVVILTIIDETEKPTYSLYVAAPLFQKIANYVVKYMKILQDNVNEGK